MNRLQFLKKLAGLCIAVPLAKCLGATTYRYKNSHVEAMWRKWQMAKGVTDPKDFLPYYIPYGNGRYFLFPDDLRSDFEEISRYIDQRLAYMVEMEKEQARKFWGTPRKTTIAKLIGLKT